MKARVGIALFGGLLVTAAAWLFFVPRQSEVSVVLVQEAAPKGETVLPVKKSELVGNVLPTSEQSPKRLVPNLAKLPNNLPGQFSESSDQLPKLLQQLKLEALAGNNVSACKLAYQLRDCKAIWARARKAGIQGGQSSESRTAEIENICPAANAMDAESDWRYWFMAANRGHVPSMVRFAALPRVNSPQAPDYEEARRTYLQSAVNFMQQALDAGEPEAAYWLSVFPLTRRYGQYLLPNDAVVSATYLKALTQVASEAYRRDLNQMIDNLATQYNFSSADRLRIESDSAVIATKLRQGGKTNVEFDSPNDRRNESSFCAESQ
jgi:hypothetical protein